MNRSILVGATLAQLAELDLLFPHRGAAVAGDFDHDVRHAPSQKRQIEVGAYPQIVGAYPQIVGAYPQIVGAPERHERRQIVGAYVEEAASQGKFKTLALPLTVAAGVSISAGATQDFELKPNRLFLPMELILPSAIAPNLIMTSLLIGGENCLLSTGAIPCDSFNNLTVHKPFKAWTASNAQPITFTLKNIHASAAQVVFGAWWGLAEV